MYFYKDLMIAGTHICRVYSVYPSFLLLHLSASSWSVVKVSQEHDSRFNYLRRYSFYCDRWAVCEGGLLLQHCGFKGKKRRRRRSRFIYKPFKKTPQAILKNSVPANNASDHDQFLRCEHTSRKHRLNMFPSVVPWRCFTLHKIFVCFYIGILSQNYQDSKI